MIPTGSSLRLLVSLLVLQTTAAPSEAADGCTVLLCLAGSWSSIAQCVSPVRAVLRDLARGRPFPACRLVPGPGPRAGGRAAADIERLSVATCPPQHTEWAETESGSQPVRCRYDGVIRVRVDGTDWSQVWWSMSGASVTQYSPAAVAALGMQQATQQDPP